VSPLLIDWVPRGDQSGVAYVAIGDLQFGFVLYIDDEGVIHLSEELVLDAGDREHLLYWLLGEVERLNPCPLVWSC
jgi:hypothetical protein